MATMKKLLAECNAVDEPYQSHNQRQMNHHSAKAVEMSRMSRNHTIHADAIQNDDTKGLHTELSRAYGSAAKAHLGLAAHHTAQFKKETNDSVKDTLKPLKNVNGKDGVK